MQFHGSQDTYNKFDHPPPEPSFARKGCWLIRELMPNSTAGQAKYLSVRNKDTYHQWTIARSITHLLRVTIIRPEKNIPDVLKDSKCTRMSRMRLIMILRGTRDGPFDSLYQLFGRENGTSKEASLGSSCEFFVDDILQRMRLMKALRRWPS